MIFHPVFGGKRIPELKYSFDGSSTTPTYDDDGNWQFSLLDTGNLIFDEDPGLIDVFLVGAGGSGSYFAGGGGGYTNTVKNIKVTPGQSYVIEIGAGACGASGGATSAFGYTAEGGGCVGGSNYQAYGTDGADGGAGGGGCSWNDEGQTYYGGDGGTDGGDGGAGYAINHGNTVWCSPGGKGQISQGKGGNTRAFGEADGELFSGGGAGSNVNAVNTSNSGAHGIGGLPGGGGYQQSGTANTGGGGGAYGGWGTAIYGGGSGIVIIRNHREEAA